MRAADTVVGLPVVGGNLRGFMDPKDPSTKAVLDAIKTTWRTGKTTWIECQVFWRKYLCCIEALGDNFLAGHLAHVMQDWMRDQIRAWIQTYLDSWYDHFSWEKAFNAHYVDRAGTIVFSTAKSRMGAVLIGNKLKNVIDAQEYARAKRIFDKLLAGESYYWHISAIEGIKRVALFEFLTDEQIFAIYEAEITSKSPAHMLYLQEMLWGASGRQAQDFRSERVK